MSEIADPQRVSEGAEGVSIRPLAYADLPGVLSIERRAFVTPWSMAMFVLELSKPSGICLAACEGDELRGYLVCSRYSDMWHLMNVAVDPGRRREGSRRALITHLLAAIEPRDKVMLEVRGSNEGAIAMYERFGFKAVGHRRRYYQDNGEDALVMELEPGRPVILAIETSCDDTCAAVVDRGEILSNVISSQAASHAAFGGVVPEIASRHHLELINPIVEAALAEAGSEPRRSRRDRGHPRSRPDRRPARGRLARRRRWQRPGACRWWRWITSTVTSRPTSSSPIRSSRRSCA